MNSIEEIFEKYSVNTTHANQVKNYALMILEALKNKDFSFDEKDKQYLETAALLHDIGYFINRTSHHKHSMNMILDMEIEGFSSEEIQIIAHIARYHRSSLPDEKVHGRYSSLNQFQKDTVNRLAPILKIADGLDNPHKNLITGIEIVETQNSFDFYIKTVGFSPKLKTAEAKKDFFESVYKKPVNFVIKKV